MTTHSAPQTAPFRWVELRRNSLPCGNLSVDGGELFLEVGHLRAAGHKLADVAAGEVVGDAFSDHLAEAQEGVAVGHQLRVDFVVGDEDHRDVATLSSSAGSQ